MAGKVRERVARFTVSLEGELLAELDRYLERKGYTNRSQGVRDIVRARFVAEEWESGDEVTVATVNLVYDHHRRELMERLAHLQHEHLDRIVSSLHVHLDHEHCLEVLVLRGPGRELERLAEALIATRGVIHGSLSVGTTGTPADTAQRADHPHPHPAPAPRRRGRRSTRDAKMEKRTGRR